MNSDMTATQRTSRLPTSPPQNVYQPPAIPEPSYHTSGPRSNTAEAQFTHDERLTPPPPQPQPQHHHHHHQQQQEQQEKEPQPQPHQEQMQATSQMNPSETPQNTHQSQRHNEKQPRPSTYWRHGLFDCYDDFGTYCLSCWCPCMVYGKNRKRLDHLVENDTADPEHGGSGCDVDCFMHATLNACCGLGWILQLGQRGTLRARHHIDGNPVNDCLTAFFCTPCELTQESQELAEEERSTTTPNTQAQPSEIHP